MSARRKHPFEGRYVVDHNGCWIWTGALRSGTSYGWIFAEGKARAAHRYSWEFHVGPIQHGKFVCHKCDVPRCINPSHLFIGSCADNVRDMVEKGRHSRGVVALRKRDGLPCSAKLDLEKVALIKELLKTGETASGIAKAFGVVAGTIRNIRSGKSWPDEELVKGKRGGLVSWHVVRKAR